VQRQTASSAYLRLPTGFDPARPGGSGVRCTIQLLDVGAEEVPAWSAAGATGEVDAPREDEAGTLMGGRGEVRERPIADLRLKGGQERRVLEMGVSSLLERAAERGAGRPAEAEVLAGPAGKLREHVDDLMREVVSKEHERYAMSAACLVMVLTGAIMAMRLRNALPLTVYLWAFFPALGTVVAISGGQQLVHGKGAIGLPVLWSGVVVLAVWMLVEYRRLARR
jgi:hypothetical protein